MRGHEGNYPDGIVWNDRVSYLGSPVYFGGFCFLMTIFALITSYPHDCTMATAFDVPSASRLLVSTVVTASTVRYPIAKPKLSYTCPPDGVRILLLLLLPYFYPMLLR